jgi:hypothetical protein
MNGNGTYFVSLGGAGGGGNGAADFIGTVVQATPGASNTGGGGGGGCHTSTTSGGAGGSGVVIIKVPDTVVGTFSGGVDFGNNSPDFDNGLPITSVAGFNIYFVSGTDTSSETVTFAQSLLPTSL